MLKSNVVFSMYSGMRGGKGQLMVGAHSGVHFASKHLVAAVRCLAELQMDEDESEDDEATTIAASADSIQKDVIMSEQLSHLASQSYSMIDLVPCDERLASDGSLVCNVFSSASSGMDKTLIGKV